MAQALKEEIALDVKKHITTVHVIFKTVCHDQNVDKNKFTEKYKIVGEAALRTLRRVDFYNQYHKSDLSEVKEAAIFAFWILKLRPFCFKEVDNFTTEHINEYVAIYLILHSIERAYEVCGIEKKIPVTIDGYRQLIYRLRNWDLSKESLMTIADLLYFYDGTKIDNLDTEESKFGRI
jgi:hypothetical protein